MTAEPARTARCAGRGQRGATLLDVLIGFLIVSIGWLAVAQMQSRLRLGSDHARQQAEAGRLAQQQFERLRAAAASASGDEPLETGAERGEQVVAIDDSDTRYRIAVTSRVTDGDALNEVRIDVSWADAAGAEQRLGLSGLLHPQPAVLALPLTIARDDRAGRVNGRHAAIPREAVAVSNGRSLFKPSDGSTQAWLFDDRTARLIARCSISADIAVAALGGTDLSSCRSETRLLIAGTLRVAPEAGSEALLAEVALQQSDGTAVDADCITERVRAVDVGTVRAPRVIAVGTAARPSDHGFADWHEVGDRFLRYHCAVAARSASGSRPHWGGRLTVVPTGWAFGQTEGTYRVCRRSSDTDRSGAIDRPVEAPAIYRSVGEALVHQNFIITSGTRACPADADPSGASTATVPHQP